MGSLLSDNAPKIFGVNWFRVNEQGEFIWPGFGDNIRILDWILKRCENEVEAKETAIGLLPYEKDINLDETDVSLEDLKSTLSIDTSEWQTEVKDIKQFFSGLGERFPSELTDEINKLEQKLKN